MASRKFACKNDPDLFCFICGHYIFGKKGRKITPNLKIAYLRYFGFEIRNEEKSWTPSLICPNCNITLNSWMSGKNVYLSFGCPVLWAEPVDHLDCYFCVINITGINSKKRKSLQYPDVTSAKKPVLHDENLPKPKHPLSYDKSSKNEPSFDTSSSENEFDAEKKHDVTQAELNDLIRDLKLSKRDSEVLASRLNQWKCLDKSTKALFGTFPDSGKKQAVLETESLTSQLDSKYTNLQHFVANLLNPKPIVDTIQEHEKFGNDGDKLRSFGTAVIGKFEGFSNVLNTAVDIPFEKAKQVGKKITNSLNAVGGKLVGL
ncbi:unnamed protein product [Brassicogethes aeneus]|uniref:Uncharacterized protein n=1 Tax=Brassicogethes aeneus TaxID=1431903 RepID=A0A9P0FLR1_BRAAE|nr:unnamed protein product [Brassicogethes aeneus]